MSAPRIRKAYSVTVRGHGEQVVFAPSASKARWQVVSSVRDAWGISFREALNVVRGVSRLPSCDVILPPRHPLANSLSPKILHCVVHAFGGSGLHAGYRDHFYASRKDWQMEAALYHCLFSVYRIDKSRDSGPDMIMYQLTDLGHNVARGELITYPSY